MTNNAVSQVETIRRFNRFYTRKIGVLTDKLLNTPYSLSDARILFELGQQQDLTATKLAEILQMDAGYLSRILSSFENEGLIQRIKSQTDGRRRDLKLSSTGRQAFVALNDAAVAEVSTMLDGLTADKRTRLMGAIAAIENILTKRSGEQDPVMLRTHQPGDIGWIVQRHGALYKEEYDLDESFEAMVAGILAELINSFDYRRDRIWIAEVDGERAGSIVAAKGSGKVVNLRLFLVEPWARGHGLGKLLIKECIRFARSAGYRYMTLWTLNILHAARHLYEQAGFMLVSEERHLSFGQDLVAQTWELKL
ncbi:MAG: helix-turn-helix domain-containing GNAT family N-acetyltransferase [Candidatus Neomarinimicrobiota bacterium]